MSEPIRVLIIEDHHIVRQGLVALLNTIPDISVVAEASDGQQATEMFRSHKPDVTLLDLRLPVLGGVEVLHRIRQIAPGARVIVLTTFDGDEDIYRALQAGARGYLLKGMRTEELIEAIRAVHAGKSRIPPVVAERLASRVGSDELTARELDVLKLIVAGKSNKEIGADLKISEATVKTHMNNIFSKMGVSDRTQAATTALQRGLVHLEAR
jgi:DNA-binding NarL/FixJ family response regulator